MKLACFTMLGMAVACSQAGVLFFDDFNGENNGNEALNYNSFDHWTVSSGTVDLVKGGGQYFPTFGVANGMFVDLDGTQGGPGLFQTDVGFVFQAGVQYELSFELAGNQRDGSQVTDTVDINIGVAGLLSESITINADQGFTLFTFTFIGNGTANPIELAFQNLGDDNKGALLDNVQVSVIPLPQTGALAGVGLLGVAGLRRRR